MRAPLLYALWALLLTILSATAPATAQTFTANPVTTGSISTTATINPTLIAPLTATITGSGGATVASFVLSTVPTTGTVRVGSATGAVAAANQAITLAQASQLYYTPASNVTQNILFTYQAIDSNSNFSSNTATYTIPLAAPASPTGCGPAYGGGPSASGLSSDYYAGYFNDNLSFFSSNTPSLTRIDPQLNFTSSGITDPDGWGNIIPPATSGGGTNPELYSSRHRGSIFIPTYGAYTFYLSSDDASFMWLDGAALAPTLSNTTISNGGLHGAVTVQANVVLAAGLHNILVYFGENAGGNILTLEYSSTAGAGISRQIVPNAALCAGPSALPSNPPTATNVTTSPSLLNTYAATAILPLAGTDPNAGGSVTNYVINSLPAASSGILYVGGVAATAGQGISAAQAATLTFDPDVAYTGNATFAFYAINNTGAVSALPATYTIPVLRVPPTGCGPAYGGGPSSSGLSSDYYAGYFNDDLSFFSSNTPSLTRIDPQLNFANSTTTAVDGWGNIIPPATGAGTDPDVYSTRHRGSIFIPTAGAYTFYLSSDDASYLWLDGAALAPTLGNTTISNGGLHGTATVQATVTLSAGLHNILVYFGENAGGNILILEYSSTAGAGITRQVVPNAALCAGPSALPPVATNVTNSPAMPNTNGATAILALAGTDPNAGGSVTNYVIATLPSAASGVLYVGGLAASAVQTITAAQAATLTFDPDAAFVGSATFTFFAINNAGIASNLAATYTIPVVGATADVTTALSGPATLGAGLSSGTYTVTFTNNGPQAATLVTQSVLLPTGASMTGAQQAALPATASYNSGTNTIDFGTVAVLNSGITNTYTFSFTSPTTLGASSLVSTVGTSISQGANTAPDQATLNVTVNTANFFVTNDDSNEVPAGTSKSGNVILNDANPANLDPSGYTATLVTGPTHGTLTFNADGSYTYAPTTGYIGADSFTYQVCVASSTPPCSNISTVALNVYDPSLVCTIGTGTNLLTNPSFASGNTGFSSTYTYVAGLYTGGNTGLIPEATYAVANDAATYHPNFAGTGRTGAGDNFMIVNGSQNLSIVYQQTLTVQPNKYYTFSAYANSVNPASPAQLGFVINNKSTSTVTTLNGTTGYVQISDLWFSGNNTSVVFEVRDVNKAFGGNDFGLDDLYFGTCATTLLANNVNVGVLSNAAPSTSIAALSATVTAGPALSSFTVQTLPSPSTGILYLNAAPVIPGQVITATQAGQLFFDPLAGFVGTATYTYTATDVTGSGSNNTATYSIAVDGRPLPVELTSFAAKVARSVDVQLNWRTASERNNDHFEVQRSLDGRTFRSLGNVAGQGTSTAPTTYAYTDASIGAKTTGLVYYRLLQVDRDGPTSYSPVQTVTFGKASGNTIGLYPNPTTAITSLDLRLLPAGAYQVVVLDNVGRQVLAATGNGGDSLPLDLKTVASGTYVVLVRGADGQQFTKRLVKE